MIEPTKPLRRSSSALARSHPSPGSTFPIVAPQQQRLVVSGGLAALSLPAEFEPLRDLSLMMAVGVPPPVAVKKERVPVVVSTPTPPPFRAAPSNLKSEATPEPQISSSGADDASQAVVGPAATVVDVKLRRSRSSTTIMRKDSTVKAKEPKPSQTVATARVSQDQIANQLKAAGALVSSLGKQSAAGGGAAAVAILSSRQRKASKTDSDADSGSDNGEAGPSKRAEKSLSKTTNGDMRRSKSVNNMKSNNLSRSLDQGITAVLSARREASSTDAKQQSLAVSSTARKTAPVVASPTAQPGVPQIKKFVVQANAYHCTFVQSMMMARGPEWKPAFRSAEKLTAAEIQQCDFVWFKYEFIKSIPAIERQRLPPNIIDKIRLRTQELRHLWNEGLQWPDHSADPEMQALDLLNVYIMPEEAESPVQCRPLDNIERTRMPNMILCQGSHAHLVGGLPASVSPEAAKAFQSLKPMLHYHNMKYNPKNPIIACFKEASAVWRKHLLYRHIKQWCDNDPKTRGSVRERCPASFEYDLNDPSAAENANEFMTTMMEKHGVVRWLAKATGGANGNGFYVTKDPADMIRYVSAQPHKAGGETDFWIIQEFVEHMPLLFGGHRFHMKVHVVMIATPVGIDIYAYKKQRIQCCSEVFDPDVMHPLSYIGNWGQQRFATNLVQEKFSTLLEDIKGEFPLLLPAWHRAKQLIAEAIEAAWLCGRQYFQFCPGCYELMGWDFVMEECPDGNWRPLLVEANHRPGFGSERKYMEKLILEVLELVMYPINGLTKYQKETHNGVVEAIWDHVKTIVIHPNQVTAEV